MIEPATHSVCDVRICTRKSKSVGSFGGGLWIVHVIIYIKKRKTRCITTTTIMNSVSLENVSFLHISSFLLFFTLLYTKKNQYHFILSLFHTAAVFFLYRYVYRVHTSDACIYSFFVLARKRVTVVKITSFPLHFVVQSISDLRT